MSLKKKLIHFSGKFRRNHNVGKSFPLNYCLPVYHNVSDEYLPHLKHIIKYKNTKEFETDLDFLTKQFQFVNWEEFKDFHNGNFKSGKKIALLTFDDGLREFYDIVVPILERKGIYAINFINPKFIDNQDLMFRCKASLIIEKISECDKKRAKIAELLGQKNPAAKTLIKKIGLINYLNQSKLDQLAENIDLDFNDFLKNRKPYLSSEQLKLLSEKGFGISAHSWDHPLFFELSTEEQIKSVNLSLDYLEKNGFAAESFAFPFTDFGIKQDFFEELFKNRNLFCSFGSAGVKTDSFAKNFQRIPMETGETAEEIFKNEITYFQMKKVLYKNKIRRK